MAKEIKYVLNDNDVLFTQTNGKEDVVISHENKILEMGEGLCKVIGETIAKRLMEIEFGEFLTIRCETVEGVAEVKLKCYKC